MHVLWYFSTLLMSKKFVSLPDPYPRNAHQKMRKSLIGLQTSFKPHSHGV